MARLNNVGLFGTRTRTEVLLTIHLLGETHASEIADVLSISLSQAQRSVDSLERAGIVVGVEEGRARRVRLSPRCQFGAELRALLDQMALSERDIQERLAGRRRRPRRASKPL